MSRLKFFAAVFLILAVGFSLTACAAKKKKEPKPKYARYAHLSNKELYRQSVHSIKKGRMSKAREKLEALLDRPSDAEYTPLARLRMGDSYYLDRGIDRYIDAVFHYKKFLRTFPRHEKCDYAQYQIAMCFFKQMLLPQRDPVSTTTAIREFEKVIKLYPESIHAETASGRIHACYRNLAEREFIIGKFYYSQGKYEGAIRRFGVVSEKYPGFFDEPEFYYYLGESHWALGNQEEGRRYFEVLFERFPATPYAKVARERIDGKPNRQSVWHKILPPYL